MDPCLQNEMLWSEALPDPGKRSAFIPYVRPDEGFRSENYVPVSNNRNMNKRMMEFLRAILRPNTTMIIGNREPPENDRRYRHMINERMRREKQRQSYLALHSMLPASTKNDKNSIVQMTTLHLRELKNLKEYLQRRNNELEARLVPSKREEMGMKKIKLRVANPSSAIDSMIGVLNCLKSMNLKARNIQSKLSVKEFSATLEIETQIDATEVEKAVQNALEEVERKFVLDLPNM